MRRLFERSAFGDDSPDRVAGMVLYSSAGGVKYRMTQHARFEVHLAYAADEGWMALPRWRHGFPGRNPKI